MSRDLAGLGREVVISQGELRTEKLLPGTVAGGQAGVQGPGGVLLCGEHSPECSDHVHSQQTHPPSHHHQPATNRAPHPHTLILDCLPSARFETFSNVLETNIPMLGLYCLIAFLQYKLFLLYNYHGHPWSRLLAEEPKDEDGMTQTKTQPITKPVIPHII